MGKGDLRLAAGDVFQIWTCKFGDPDGEGKGHVVGVVVLGDGLGGLSGQEAYNRVALVCEKAGDVARCFGDRSCLDVFL